MNGVHITYDEYLGFAALNIAQMRNQRVGQVFFNALHPFHPNLADEVRGTVLDPFYDDDRLPDFLEYIQDRWGGVE